MVPSRSGEAYFIEERGGVRFGVLLFLVVLGAGFYVGVGVVRSEFDFRSLQKSVERQVGLAESTSDDDIRGVIVDRMRELGLPSSAERVQVQRLAGGGAVVSLAYPDTVTFLGRWDWIRIRRIRIRGSH